MYTDEVVEDIQFKQNNLFTEFHASPLSAYPIRSKKTNAIREHWKNMNEDVKNG